jgi:hypothetical protein
LTAGAAAGDGHSERGGPLWVSTLETS